MHYTNIEVITLGLLIGMILSLLGILVVYFSFQKKKEELRTLFRRFLIHQEMKQKNRSKNIHHAVGGTLSALKLNANIMSKKHKDDPLTAEFFADSKTILTDTIAKVREVCHDLYPTTLSKFGLYQALSELTATTAKIEHMEVEFASNLEEESLDESLELTLIRMCQDLVNFSMLEAEAHKIQLSIQKQQKKVILRYADDSTATSSNSETLNNAFEILLLNFRSRAMLFDGQLELSREKGKGIWVEVSLPIPPIIEK